MASTVYIIHGTEGHPEENWFPWLKGELEKIGCQVIVPQFPSPPVVPAKISEWFEAFDQYLSKLDQDSIVVGHSLGGIFTLRLLEKLKSQIKAAVCVGAPIGVRPILNYDRDEKFSGFDFDWDTIKHNAQKVAIYQSDDDPYVSLGNGQKLADELGVKLSFIPKAGHFNTKSGYTTFEPLLETVKTFIKA